MRNLSLNEVIKRFDEYKPNKYTQSEKVQWLSELDQRIYNEIFKTHEGNNLVSFDGYADGVPVSAMPALVAEPYSIVYQYWMEAKVDYHNRDFAAYNVSSAMFNQAYNDYERYYNRTHMPNGTKLSVLS